MEQTTVTHHRWDDIPKETLSDVLDRKLITGDRIMLAHVYLKKGANRSSALARERADHLHPRRRPAILDRP